MSSSSDDDRPLARPNSLARSMDVDKPNTNGAKRKSRSSIAQGTYGEGSDSDGQPMAKRQKPALSMDSDSDNEPISKTTIKRPSQSYAAADSSDDDKPLKKKVPTKRVVKDESDDDVPIAKTAAARRQSNGTASAKRKSNGVKKDESDSDAPISKSIKAKTPVSAKKGKPAAAATKAVKKDVKKIKVKDEDEGADEDEYEWWNDVGNNDDTIKWKTLEHNGVLLAPEYEPLPKSVKLYYDGKPVTLGKEAEEVATFWVAMMTAGSQHHLENPTFRKNFAQDFAEYIKKYGATDAEGNKILMKDLDKCDFSKIHAHMSAKIEAKKATILTKEEKEVAKAKKDALEAPYVYCMWDGRKQKVGNFRVEPPSLFRGRGEHPKTGKVKRRVLPEQITINIGKGAKVPQPPPGHKWKSVQHDQGATWLACWTENINNATKYVMLGAASDVKGQSDWKKFEKARELKKHIEKIRRDYTKELKSEVMADRQRATAMYLIDKLALRAGNEKDPENEAETVGCCSLKFEHITLHPPCTVQFDFLGKDSIPYQESTEVEPQVFKNLKLFKKPPKREGDDLFDRLTTSQLNKHLNNYMPGLTAKVFRTYNASITMSRLMMEVHKDPRIHGSDAEKQKLYNDCNRKVAILCNHKRTVTAGHENSMGNLLEKGKGLRYQKYRLKRMILDLDPTQKKKKGAAFFEIDDDMDKDWIKEHHELLVEETKTKLTKKFEKENEKRKAEKVKEMPKSELKERLLPVKELEKKLAKELKTGKVEAEGKGITVEKLYSQIEKMDDRIRKNEIMAEDKNDNKEVALSTSKTNYIDPRLTAIFAKKANVPIEKLLGKGLRDKFRWAIKTVENLDDWEF